VARVASQPFVEPVLLNVNVPDVAPEQLQGIVVTRLGKRHKAHDTGKTVNPRNQTMYWVGAAGGAQDAGPGTDFHAVQQNQVSITPLQIDLTRYTQMDQMREWHVNAEAMRFADSTGIGALVRLKKRALDARIAVRFEGWQPSVMKTLKIARVDSLFAPGK
jgi:anti-anti-sigma factor